MAPQGEMVRWCIGRVDTATSTAYAEVVIAPHPDVKVTRQGIRRMLGRIEADDDTDADEPEQGSAE